MALNPTFAAILDTWKRDAWRAATQGDRPMPAYEFDTYDAMIVALIATETFTALSWPRMNLGQRRGALLLYEAILSRCAPHLPQTADLAHVHRAVARAREIARAVDRTNEETS